jgi:HK97 family phage portal protein
VVSADTIKSTVPGVNLFSTTRALLSGGADAKAVLRPAGDEPRPAIFGPPVTRRVTQRNARLHSSTYAGDNAVDWVMNAVTFWADAAADAVYHFEKDGERMATTDTPGDAEDYPGGKVPASLEGLIRQPNPFHTYEDMIWYLVADLLLTGNAYWLRYRADEDGKPLALYRLAPPFITILPGEKAPVAAYEYHVDGQSVPLTFSADEVIHFKRPNPNDPLYGAGVISGSPRVYDIELALVETMAQFFESGAKLSGVVTSDRNVPDPLVNKIRRQFSSMYSGSNNAYKVAVLERGLNFSPIQPTAAEAQFAELTKLGKERVYDMFGLHPALISGDAAKPNLVEEAQRRFDTKKMKPFLGRLSRHMSSELTHAWGGIDFKIDYEYVMPEKDRLTLAAVYSALPGIKVKEVREYVGLEPLGDERDEMLLNMPGLGVEEGGTPMGAMPGAAGGRPANPNNLSAFPGRADERTSPDARYRRTSGSLKKALESGDPAALEQVLEEAQAAHEALDQKAVTLTDRTAAVLEKYRNAPKAERAQAVAELAEGLPGGTRQLRGRVIAHVAEGIRRGYTVDQIINGAPDEQFPGLRERISGVLEEVEHGAEA